MGKPRSKKVVLVAGARPNFMKIAPIHRALRKAGGFSPVIVHTGQHYDPEMSRWFFRDLGLPRPDIALGVGSGSHAVQTAGIMIGLEKIFLAAKPALVMVVGDVNSTLAGALTAAKLVIPVAHVEAGLRSRDRTMPEEINRILADSVSDFLFTTCREAGRNLRDEGIPPRKIFFVGNVMIDSLLACREKAARSGIVDELGLAKGNYAVLTLHRPSNVDEPGRLARIMSALKKISRRVEIVFPVHPRTEKTLKKHGIDHGFLRRLGPLGYLDFLSLLMNSRLTLTDSGGIQEESAILKVPCLTLRNNTERSVTIEAGTNTLVGTDPKKIVADAERILAGDLKIPRRPPLWDGRAAERIVRILSARL